MEGGGIQIRANTMHSIAEMIATYFLANAIFSRASMYTVNDKYSNPSNAVSALKCYVLSRILYCYFCFFIISASIFSCRRKGEERRGEEETNLPRSGT